MQPAVRRVAAVVTAGVLAAGVAVVTGPGRSSAAAGALTFSTPTVIDPLRQGFEPNLALDQHSGALYSSVPNGTPGTSSLWRSDDGGAHWHLVEGNVQSEPSTCPAIAGGDTELAVDPVDGSIYYADLQPLTNFNMSVSHDKGRTWMCNPISVPDSGVDRQWFAIDSNGGQNAVTNGGRMYFDYDDTTQSPSPATGNVLVVNATTNGLQFGSVCAASVCAGPSTRVTLNEGLPGNLVVDDAPGSAHQHSVYALHSSADLTAVILSRCKGAANGVPADAATAQAYCLDPTAADPTNALLSTHWTDTVVHTSNPTGVVSNNFTTLATDTAGNLYALWSEYPGTVVSSSPVTASYNYTGPSRLLLATSTDGGTSWSAPQQINPPSLPNNTQPWLTVGSPGRVAVAWYGAAQATGPDGSFGPNGLLNGVWNVDVAENLDALRSTSWSLATAGNHPAKLGAVSTEGLQLPTGPDRSLGDFMKVTHDANGAVELVYVDDNTLLDPGFQDSGPVVYVHQTGGPSLFANGTVPPVPQNSLNAVSDVTGNAYLSARGSQTAAPPHLDLTGASVSMADATHLTVTLSVADPQLQSNLGPDTTLDAVAATSDSWIVRWDFDPATLPSSATPGGYFVAMENDLVNGQRGDGGAIETNVINPVTPTLYTYSFPSGSGVQGSVRGNTITWTVPLAAIGNPAVGSHLYEVQGVTLTQNIPSQNLGDPTGVGLFRLNGSILMPNVIDTTRTFDAVLGLAATPSPTGTATATPTAGSIATVNPGLVNTAAVRLPMGAAAAVAVVGAVVGVAGGRRRRRRRG